jgi:hypothetical protein
MWAIQADEFMCENFLVTGTILMEIMGRNKSCIVVLMFVKIGMKVVPFNVANPQAHRAEGTCSFRKGGMLVIIKKKCQCPVCSKVSKSPKITNE